VRSFLTGVLLQEGADVDGRCAHGGYGGSTALLEVRPNHAFDAEILHYTVFC
jgi:hypothetical protein